MGTSEFAASLGCNLSYTVYRQKLPCLEKPKLNKTKPNLTLLLKVCRGRGGVSERHAACMAHWSVDTWVSLLWQAVS